MANITDAATAELYAAAIRQLTGVSPTVDYSNSRYAVIRFSPAEQVKARAWVESQLSSAPGPVQVDLMPVLLPSVAKRALPFILGAFALGFISSRILR